MMTKRGAIIGCGFFAENHFHAWAELSSVEIVAVCDTDLDKAKGKAKKFNIPNVYNNAEVLLQNEKLDFVDIVTTASSHRFLVELACRYRVHCICQKPLAENLTDAKALVEAAASAQIFLLVHENFRWQKGFCKIKEHLDSGKIGDIQFARFCFRHGYNNYQNQPYLAEIKRFVIMDVGLHLFDLARNFLGDVEKMSCTTQRLNPNIKGEDAFTALLRHQNGAVSICDASFASTIHPDPFPNTQAWLEGSRMSLELRTDFSLVLHQTSGKEVIDVSPDKHDWSLPRWSNVQDSVLRFNQHALSVFCNNAKPQPSGEDNFKTVKLALAAYEAAEESSCIKLDEFFPQ